MKLSVSDNFHTVSFLSGADVPPKANKRPSSAHAIPKSDLGFCVFGKEAHVKVKNGRGPCGRTPYVVFIGGIFQNTTESCLKRMKHGGYE